MVSCNEIGSETETLKRCLCKCRLVATAILVVLIAGVVCWHIHHPKRSHAVGIDPQPGTKCTIHFRQDAFILRANTGTSLPIIDTGATTVAFTGTLIAMNREAILVIVEPNPNDVGLVRQFWIPKSSILLIEYDVL